MDTGKRMTQEKFTYACKVFKKASANTDRAMKNEKKCSQRKY